MATDSLLEMLSKQGYNLEINTQLQSEIDVYKCKNCGDVIFTVEFIVDETDEFKQIWHDNHRLTKLDNDRRNGKCVRTKKKRTTKNT